MDKINLYNSGIRRTEKILVIGPGASTRMARRLYKEIEKNYSLLQVHINDTNYSWSYPDMWQTDNPNLETTNGHNLGTFAYILFDILLKFKIKVILCGSRGGQVILPQLIRIYENYRQYELPDFPPSIIMNSGIIHTICKWPINSPMILLSFGNDYFNTKNPNNIIKYTKYQNNYGYIIHIPNETHAPKRELHLIINDLIKYIPSSRNICSTNYNILKNIIQNKINNAAIYAF